MSDLSPAQRHPHYFKSVEGLTHIDVYRVLSLFEVTDPCIAHAVKKLLVAGARGDKALVSTLDRDVKEAIDSLQRWQEIRRENADVPVTLDSKLFTGAASVRVGGTGEDC